MDDSHEMRPAEMWYFIEPIACDTGIIRRVGYGLDICHIGHECYFEDDRAISIQELGFIAVRHEKVIIKEPYENDH